MKTGAILLVLLSVIGCAKPPRESQGMKASFENGIWRAYRDNGDKPGFGFEVRVKSQRVTGAYYIMHPDHVGDFAKGKRVPAKVTVEDTRRLCFELQHPGQEPERLVFDLRQSLRGSRVPASIEWVPNVQLEFEFRKDP